MTPPGPPTHPALNIAVVGGGLSGLAAAWMLGRGGHRVTLYERQARPGFTAASVAAPGRAPHIDVPQRIDVPLRVFYPGYYPSLTRLYQALGVASEPVSYAASFMDETGRLYFRYRNLRLGDRAIGVLAPQDLLLGARAWRIVAGLLRFHRQAVPAMARGALAGLSLGELAQAHAPDFVEGFLLPAICTVCTCSPAAARAFPAEVIVDYLARGLARDSVRRALHGADGVEQRLREGIPELRCSSPVSAVRRQGDVVKVHLADGSVAQHAHVVLAAQANHARELLLSAGEQAHVAEAEVLAGFRYQPVQVLTHTDAALMPLRRRDWSPVNLRVPVGADDSLAPESTIWVNAVQPGLRQSPPVFQTVHPHREPREGSVIGRARFERPVVDSGNARALAALQRLHAEADRRIWFCGSYAQAGIPLLESAVRSAQEVAARLGPEPLPPGRY